ncbi:hypothetical protein P4O66_015030 [Electrophorus voltai]|uniref:protein-serine/threonine phosphatase n=1 Tax=Electrophorus voltai TaxID=2609070 RepID=A0AAD8YYF6_9TELE|nr:hypothetical protein P4O66_015030 [Electrophorus voltai]
MDLPSSSIITQVTKDEEPNALLREKGAPAHIVSASKKPRKRGFFNSLLCCLCHDEADQVPVNNNAPLLVEENGTISKGACGLSESSHSHECPAQTDLVDPCLLSGLCRHRRESEPVGECLECFTAPELHPSVWESKCFVESNISKYLETSAFFRGKRIQANMPAELCFDPTKVSQQGCPAEKMHSNVSGLMQFDGDYIKNDQFNEELTEQHDKFDSLETSSLSDCDSEHKTDQGHRPYTENVEVREGEGSELNFNGEDKTLHAVECLANEHLCEEDVVEHHEEISVLELCERADETLVGKNGDYEGTDEAEGGQGPCCGEIETSEDDEASIFALEDVAYVEEHNMLYEEKDEKISVQDVRVMQNTFDLQSYTDKEPRDVSIDASEDSEASDDEESPEYCECEFCVPAAEQVPAKPLLPQIKSKDVGKICVVIDLDETLVHSSFKPVNNADFIIPVEIDGAVHQVYVLKRPHVDEFLKRMGELFECVLFTASLAKYADPVSDLLDKWGAFRCRLFRESCVFHRGNYVKDLSRLGRDLNKVIIVDNSPASYIFHPDNAVPVASWFDDMSDTELLDLIPFFERLSKVDDVYAVLTQQRTSS